MRSSPLELGKATMINFFGFVDSIVTNLYLNQFPITMHIGLKAIRLPHFDNGKTFLCMKQDPNYI